MEKIKNFESWRLLEGGVFQKQRLFWSKGKTVLHLPKTRRLKEEIDKSTLESIKYCKNVDYRFMVLGSFGCINDVSLIYAF